MVEGRIRTHSPSPRPRLLLSPLLKLVLNLLMLNFIFVLYPGKFLSGRDDQLLFLLIEQL